MRAILIPVGKLSFFTLLMLGVWTFLSRGLPRETAASASQVTSRAAAALDDDALQVIGDVNREFALIWKEQDLRPAPSASWQTVCRRVSLALVGTGLSLEEMRWLEQLPEEQRIDSYVEKLLQDERFTSYWGERFARTFVSNDEGPFLVYRRRRFVNWLSEQLKENRPYDQIVRAMLQADGFATDNPPVNFVTLTLQGGPEEGQPDPVRLAARTTRAVLGMRIDCLQCHDDFLDTVRLGDPSDPRTGVQQDFHQLAAFYATARMTPLQGIHDQDRQYRYKYLHAEEETEVPAQVPFARELLPDAGKPRERLAKWATHRDNLPAMRAAVGRLWAFMFGRPLTGAVDDIPLFGALPPGLDRLAKDFAAHNFDIHRMIRIISRLDVFRLDSRSPEGVSPEHESAWAVFPLVPLRPEQVAGSIIQACQLKTVDRDRAFILQLQAYGESNEFVKRYGDTGEDEFKQDAVTITQRLLLMNGNLVRERTNDNPLLNAATQIAIYAPQDADAVQAAFLATLNRTPTDLESSAFTARLESSQDKRKGLQDIYWALLNSTEFSWNH